MRSPSLDPVLSCAAEEALRLGHSYVGPEHLFVACSRNASPERVAVLARHGLEPQVLRAAIGTALGRELQAGDRHTAPPLSSRARRALDLAAEHRAASHASGATADDLLVALLEDAIATGGVVGAVLAQQGVAPITLRAAAAAVEDPEEAT